MKLSTRARYGTRALLDIATYSRSGPVLLRDIAKRQSISEQYLEHVIIPLRVAGLVRSIRGVRGGFLLARPPTEIKLAEVVNVLEGSLSLVDCVDDPNVCPRSDVCVTRDLWADMKSALSQTLQSTTLQDLMEQQREKAQPEGPMYYI